MQGSRNILGIYWWAMKYFWKFLMGQKIFLCRICSFLILTFSKFVWKFNWVWVENVQIGRQEDLRKIRHVKQKQNSLSYVIKNGSKSTKINFECILTLLLGSLTLVMGYKIHFCDDFSSIDFIHLIPFFPRIVWITKLHNLMKRFFSNKGYHGSRKKTFSRLS